MKKVYMVLSILFLILITNRITSNAQTATAPSGSGTIGDPYLIATVENLYWVATQTNSGNSFSGKYLKQTADLDASATSTWFGGQGWMPIGYSTDNGFFTYYIFSGNYDGQNHIISNLLINRTVINGYGLFGITDYATIKNLGVTNITIIATGDNDMYAGGLIGYAIAGNTIENCYSTGSVTCRWSPGGLIGAVVDESNPNTVTNCYSDCDVIATYWVAGGLIAESYLGSTITNCYSTGSVTALGEITYVGGLIGNNVSDITNCYSTSVVTAGSGGSIGGLIGDNYGNISNCYFSGSVVSTGHEVGGLIGRHSAYYGSIVNNCYSSGVVFGIANTGGLIGLNTGVPATNVTNCFWDSQTSGQVASPGGGTSKTTIEMKTASTFTNAGWSAITWILNDGIYPILSWQGTFSGAVNSDWSTAGNWFSGSIPTAANDVVIAAGKTAVIAPGASASCNNITIDATGSLTIQSSSATNAGSLIVAGTATGNVTFESYLAETGKWHVVAAPVAAQNIWSFATLAGNSIAANTGKRAVTEYNEGTNTWDTNYPTSDTEGSFAAGSGYSVLRSDAGVVAYTGTINTNNVTKPLTRTLYGWNALGNPYTSAINATVSAHATNNLITANSDAFQPSFAALYVWDAATNQYVTINNAGTGSLVQNYIQAGQGFFVRAKDNSGLNFSITEAMQTHQTSTPLKSGETAWPAIQLVVRANAKQSSTVLAFNNQMTNGLDITYDAGMFKADKNFALYSRLVDDNGVDFAIQALPENYNNLVVPLGIDVPVGTEITFSAETMNLPADAAVYLEDKAAKTFTQLDLTDAGYTVIVTDKTKGTGNFFLHTSAATTAINELENNLKVYTRDRAIYISGNLETTDVVAVYSIVGKLHYKKTAEKTGLLRIDSSKIPSGVYLVSIEQKTGKVTRKVVISE